MIDSNALRQILVDNSIDFKEGGRSYIMDCPRCGKRDKMYIRKNDGRFICWVCAESDNFQGRPEFALAELTGLSLKELYPKLYGLEVPKATVFIEVDLKDFWADGEDEISTPQPLKAMQWPLNYYPIDHQWSKRGAEYLAGRGVPLDVALRYGVRYCPERRRVAFPVAHKGILYGWQDRLVVPHEWTNEETAEKVRIPKALTSDGLRKDQTLMFADRIDGMEHVVLSEGPISAMKADLCGGNVATMGKAVSPAQIQLIRNSGVKRLYLALDPDAARETANLVSELGSEMEVYNMTPRYGDIGDMSFTEVYELFRNAPRVNAAHVFVFLGK